MATTLAVCADDYGLHAGGDAVIADLAAAGRLTHIACLVTAPAWRGSAQRLAMLPAAVETGLHFNLSDGQPLSAALRRVWPQFPSLPRLLALAALRRLPLAAIADEWQAQWDGFCSATGRPPQFVDGHQHVHHLPGVRDIVLAALAPLGGAVAVRNTGGLLGPGGALKRAVIRHGGGLALQAELQRRGLPHNSVLVGSYGFDDTDYRSLLRRWLAVLPPQGGLLFCHPGDGDDAIAAARRREAAYLGGADFVADLQQAGVSLGPAWRRRSSAG